MWKFVRLIIIAAIFVYFASLVYVVSFSMKKSIPAHVDAVLILGAKVNLDNSPSSPLYNRSEEAIKLYKEGHADYIITTGGVGLGELAESKAARQLALEAGVPADKILGESLSHNTYDSIYDIQNLAKSHDIKSIIVVSDQYHVARGVLFARHFNFSPVYWDYPSISYYSDSDIVWNYLREAAAVLAYTPQLFNLR